MARTKRTRYAFAPNTAGGGDFQQSIPARTRARMRAAHEADKAPERAHKRLAQAIGAAVITSMLLAALAILPGPKPQPMQATKESPVLKASAVKHAPHDHHKRPTR